MKKQSLPTRTRKTNLGCRVVEKMHMEFEHRRQGKLINLWHDIVLSCDKPYIKGDKRSKMP